MRLERFLGRIGWKALELQSARIPAYRHFTRPWRRIAGCDVYLVGDAAAQVKVIAVGGLVTGLRGARATADAISSGRNLPQRPEVLTARIEFAFTHQVG